jgi:uncharacterized phage protein (TIGR02220 family)
MAKQRLVETSIWQDKWFLQLSADGKLLFLFILTHPLMRESGFIEIPDMMIIPYLYPLNRLDKARKEITDKVRHDPNLDLYLVVNFYKKHCRSPKMIKPAVNDLQRYKSSPLVSLFCTLNANIADFKALDIPYIYPIDTLEIGCNDNDSESDNESDNEYKSKDNYKELAIKVLDHLNKTTSSVYRPVGNNLDLIVARLRDMRDNPVGIDKYPDIPLEEWAYNVINIKNAKWCKDEKMRDFLRPTTLFRKTNFENYLSEVLTVFGRGK